MNRNVTLALVLAASLAACAKKPPPQLPPAPPETTMPTQALPTTPTGPQPGSQADFVATVSSDRIFFGLDKSDVDAEDQATLQSQAAWMARYPNVRATIEGHCDERGTREYNLALGERRANATKNALVALGVSAERLTTVSYGKERPDATGSDEDSYSRNRRAVTVTVG